jgi:beta-xylosidase
MMAMVGCTSTTKPTEKDLKVCIFPGDYPDPTIMREGDDYYMTHSSLILRKVI